MDRILIDSAALIALADAPDRYHHAATETYKALMDAGVQLVTTNHIVDETCTRLLWNSRRGHQAAAAFGRTIREKALSIVVTTEAAIPPSPHRLVVIHTNPDLERRAWEIFEKHDTARFSFTDCVSFAVMESLKIKQAFTFDEHYDVMGFERLPAIDLSDRA